MPSPPPSTVRAAAALVGLEGTAAVTGALVFLIRGVGGADRQVVDGFGNAAWFAVIGGSLLTAAWALWTGRRWGRGIAVFAQLLLLPVTWYVGVGSHRWFYGIPIAAGALAALVLLFAPATLRWLANDSAGAGGSGPETR